MQTRTAGIREHVEHIEFLFRFLLGYLVGFSFYPPLLPLLFNLPEIIFHTVLLLISEFITVFIFLFLVDNSPFSG